jgi:hypothetical protein
MTAPSRASRADASPRVTAAAGGTKFHPEPGAEPEPELSNSGHSTCEIADVSKSTVSNSGQPEPAPIAEPAKKVARSAERPTEPAKRPLRGGQNPPAKSTGEPAPAPLAAEPAVADVVLADVVAVLSAALAERDAAISALTALIAEMRADHALLAARVDAIDPPNREPLPGFVTLKQAAGACGFNDETVRQWARDGEVTGLKDGGGWRVELASVMERAGRR